MAHKAGKTVTFMPKPIFGDNGSGMHTHQSLWKKASRSSPATNTRAFRQMALWYAGGLLKHAPRAFSAFAAPTTNSYKRLVPGYEAPVNLAYSQPQSLGRRAHPDVLGQPQGEAAGVPSARPVVQSVSRLFGDVDGGPRRHREQDRSRQARSTRTSSNCRRRSCRTCLRCPARSKARSQALEQDHAFLTKGGVFTKEFIDLWIDYKMANEVNPMRMRPHPYEFHLYYDI